MQAALGHGPLRGVQLDRLAPPHDPLSAGPLLSDATAGATQRKAPALTVPQVHAVLPLLLPRFLPTLNQALDFLSYRERYNLAARWAHIRLQLRDDPLAA